MRDDAIYADFKCLLMSMMSLDPRVHPRLLLLMYHRRTMHFGCHETIRHPILSPRRCRLLTLSRCFSSSGNDKSSGYCCLLIEFAPNEELQVTTRKRLATELNNGAPTKREKATSVGRSGIVVAAWKTT